MSNKWLYIFRQAPFYEIFCSSSQRQYCFILPFFGTLPLPKLIMEPIMEMNFELSWPRIICSNLKELFLKMQSDLEEGHPCCRSNVKYGTPFLFLFSLLRTNSRSSWLLDKAQSTVPLPKPIVW